jgi:hypothetical protein
VIVYQTRDPILVERIINQPHMLEACGYTEQASADFSEIVTRPDYILLTNGLDAFGLFHGPHGAIWEAHSALDRTCRGRRAIDAWASFFEWMWLNTPARIITAAPHNDNKPARWMCRRMGMECVGESDQREWFKLVRP